MARLHVRLLLRGDHAASTRGALIRAIWAQASEAAGGAMDQNDGIYSHALGGTRERIARVEDVITPSSLFEYARRLGWSGTGVSRCCYRRQRCCGQWCTASLLGAAALDRAANTRRAGRRVALQQRLWSMSPVTSMRVARRWTASLPRTLYL